MKKLFSILTIFALTATFAFAQTEKPAEAANQEQLAKPATSGAIMTFESTEVDYGTIEQHADPLRVFNFVNTGDEPLVIKHAKGSCGCTVPTYPKQPIMPGEKATIEVRYDTKRVGPFTKTVTLTTNETVDKRVLKIKGKVNKKPKEADAVPASKPNVFSLEN